MPIRCILECNGRVQNDPVSEPTADQLHPDRQALSVDPAGKGASWQAEHAREAKKIGMIVTGVACVVAIAFDSIRN